MLDAIWSVIGPVIFVLGIVGFFSMIGGLLFIGIFLLRIMDSPAQVPPKEGNQHQ